MPDIFNYCAHITPLSEDALTDLSKSVKTKTYKKGRCILKKGQVCRYIYFTDYGLIKSFFYSSDKQLIMRFFSANLMFSVFDSFVNQTPSAFSLVALEDTGVTIISHQDMMTLCGKHHCMETLFRKLLSIATTKMVKRIREMLEASATERYDQFLKENGDIMQRISLGDIANYLGITIQSLSRIRASVAFLPNDKKGGARP